MKDSTQDSVMVRKPRGLKCFVGLLALLLPQIAYTQFFSQVAAPVVAVPVVAASVVAAPVVAPVFAPVVAAFVVAAPAGLLEAALFQNQNANAGAQDEASASQRRLGTVTGDRVNVRSGPSTNHPAFAQLRRGAEIVVIAAEGDWYKIHLPGSATCWISAEHVSEINDDSARVEGKKVMVRVTPGTEHNAIGHVTQGQILRLTHRRDPSGKWLEFYAPQSATAYISKDFVKLGESLTSGGVTRVIDAGEAPLRPATELKGNAATDHAAKDQETGIVAGAGKKDSPPPSREGVRAGVGDGSGDGANDSRAGRDPNIRLSASPRLRGILEKYAEERKKPIVEWQLAGLLAELQIIAKTSEDVGEAEVASGLLDELNEDCKFQREMLELDRKLRAAEQELANGEHKDSEVTKAVHTYPPQEPEDEFLATGWVVALGKNSQLDCTHKLMKGNRLLFYLKSDQVNLDDYLNKCVGLRGNRKEIPKEMALSSDIIQVTDIHVLSN